MRTLRDLLERGAGRPDAGLRLLDRREQESFLPWAEVRRRARAVAGGLQALGVEPGQRVALVFPTGPGFFDAFFGALEAGAVPVPLYPPVRLGRLDEYLERTARMLRLSGARLLLADPLSRRVLGPAVEQARPALGCRLLDQLPAGRLTDAERGPEDLALVQFSSGSTMEPKAVALSHRALLAQAVLLNGYWPARAGSEDAGVSWLPLYHDMGLIGCVLPALERPATLTLLPPELFLARPAVWLRAISRHRGTISPAPSFAFALCAERIRDEELDGVDLSCWRVALNGAEPVSADVMRRFAGRFARWGFRAEALTPVYGLSEAALAVTFADPDERFRSLRLDRDRLAAEGRAIERDDGVELVSLGRPLPGFELRVVAPDGRACGEGRVGRVQVRGPSLMAGYLGQQRETERALRDGWLDTGDLGFLSGGELVLTGRAKDVLIVNGRNHSPSEVEAAVEGVAGVRGGRAVAVSWRPEEAAAEQVLLLVEASRGLAEHAFAEVADACARAVRAACNLAVRVEVLAPGTLPRTSSGKLRRREALRLWLERSLAGPRPVTPLRLALAVARSELAFARLRWRRSDAR